MRGFGRVALVTALMGASTIGVTAAEAAPPPAVSILDEFVVESISGEKEFEVTLTLSSPPASTVRVTFGTENGSAVSGSDYLTESDQLSFTEGQTQRKAVLTLVGDDSPEGDETFVVSLSDPVGVTIADGSADVLVIDDDGEDGGPGDPPRDCTDKNVYTTDSYDAAAGYCLHEIRPNADEDDDRWKAAEVGKVDCNDADADIHPNTVEIAGDGIDNNCDGITDGGPRDCSDDNPYTNDKYSRNAERCTHKLRTDADDDSDGWVAAQVGGADCADADRTVHPLATESTNGRDDDCDGQIDEGGGGGAAESVTPIPGVETTECPVGAECSSYVVRCEGTPPVRAYVATEAPTAPARGVIVLYSGARGENFWGAQHEDVVDDLRDEGYEVDRVAWPDGWVELLDGPPGLDVAGCRPSAMTQFLHDTRYLPLDLSPVDYECGFCVGGNSGGALQAAYGLTEYGLDAIVDAAIITSGPSLAALAEGCLDEPEYRLSQANRELVDLSYGFLREDNGPCATGDPAYEQIWRDDSIVDGADDVVYPDTRVEVVLGGEDTTTVPAGARLWLDVLMDAGSPSVTETVYPTAGHGLTAMLNDAQARAGIIASFAYSP